MIPDRNTSPAWWLTATDSHVSKKNTTQARQPARPARFAPPRNGWGNDEADSGIRRDGRRGGGSGCGVVSAIVALIVLLLLVIGVSLVIKKNGASGGANAVSRYETTPLAQGNLRPTVTAIGNLKPLTEVTVGSEISGIIRKIYVKTNDVVTKGQIIAQIDTERLSQQVEAAKASAALAESRVLEAQARLSEARSIHERKKSLFEKSQGRTPSRVEMQTIEADFNRATHVLAAVVSDASAAAARLRTLEADLSKTKILSPVDGVVLKSNFEEGATVAAGYRAPELFVIAEKLSQMKVVVGVSEADISRVQVGQKASFTVDTWRDKTYDAVITKVERAATNTDNVVTYDVEIQVPNADLSLRSGMTVTATIFTEEISGAWLVPSQALSFSPSGIPRKETRPGNAVLWLLEKGKPKPIEVRAGRGNAQHTEVIGEALSDGLTVIVGVKSE